jgi:hypothetical protein
MTCEQHPESTIDPRGRCRACHAATEYARRHRGSIPKAKQVPMSDSEKRLRKQAQDFRRRGGRPVLAVDGLEDEFGPAPAMQSTWTWYDQVAVNRAVSGVRPVGRRLTPLETKEVARIRAEKETLVGGLTWAGIKG